MGRDCICFLGLGYCDHGDELGRPMTDLISREAVIEAIEALPPMFSARDAIEALTNMPSVVTVTESPTLTITYTERDALDDMDDDDLQWWLENKE